MDQDNEQKPKETTYITYDFKCSSCNMEEVAHYKGTSPPFSRNIILKYSSYVIKDPFSPPGKGEILILGADCALCDKPVCINKECSIFYTKMYCCNCVNNNLEQFPKEVGSKLVQMKKK